MGAQCERCELAPDRFPVATTAKGVAHLTLDDCLREALWALEVVSSEALRADGDRRKAEKQLSDFKNLWDGDLAMRWVLGDLAAEALENSKAWFPGWHADLPMPLAVGYALGFGGEAGEVLNAVKKVYRDRGLAGGDQRMEHVAEEIADALIYMLLLMQEMDIDLVTAYRRKIAYNDGRFGRHGKEVDR